MTDVVTKPTGGERSTGGGVLPEVFRIEGNLIPKGRYTAQEFVELENEKLWPFVWQVACREEDIARVGDYLEYKIGDQSIVLVRSAPDLIKGFHNVCLHRGALLKEGSGNIREIRCPYHAWRYSLDGSIKEVPDEHEFPAMERECLHLFEVLVDTWGGLVFVNMDPNAEPLQDFLRPIPSRLDYLEPEKMRVTHQLTYALKANWKFALDAFQETYHYYGIHPQTLMYQDPGRFVYEQYGIHSRMGLPVGENGKPSPRLGMPPDPYDIVSRLLTDFASTDLVGKEEFELLERIKSSSGAFPDGETPSSLSLRIVRESATARGQDLSKVSDEDVFFTWDWNIFPNCMFVVWHERGFVWRFRPDGTDPGSCFYDLWILRRFASDEEVPAVEQAFIEDPSQVPITDENRVIMQDIVNIPVSYKGMHARPYRNLICGRHETNIMNFHRALTAYVSR